jgi:hypothetical protein
MDNLSEAYLSVYQELDEEAPEKITKPAKSPRLMKNAGPARVHNPSPKKVEEDVDLFDYLLDYLVAEGYADTNDAAIAIMANMSEEWRESITEGAYEDRIAANNKKYDRNRQRAAQSAAARNRARQEGKTGNVPGVGYVSPRPEGETYRDSSGVERHTSGARMPKKDS